MKCRNLEMISNHSLDIMSENPGVDIILLVEKYDHTMGFCTIPINKYNPNTI
jgi:hypothetical protein